MRILVAGETVLDLISQDFTDRLEAAAAFTPLAGGSAANLALNLARLGVRSGIAACFGADGWGAAHRNRLHEEGVNLDCSHVHPDLPTTLVLVSRSVHTPDFQVYRGADSALWADGLPAFPDTLQVFHTTCFALSRQPARSQILQAADHLASRGLRLSIDTNYSPKVWPDRQEALAVMAAWCQYGGLVKCSEDDWERLSGGESREAEEAIDFFLRLGAAHVCITLGARGCVSATLQERISLPALPLDRLVDTTGAGDAFWAGYLTAHLNGAPPSHCAQVGLATARAKLQVVGPIPADWAASAFLASFNL